MSNYIRPYARGASVFFTVALAERGTRLLVDEIGVLRRAVEMTRAERPFEIDAWVVLPERAASWKRSGGSFFSIERFFDPVGRDQGAVCFGYVYPDLTQSEHRAETDSA